MAQTLIDFGVALMATGLVALTMKTRAYRRVMTCIVHTIVGKAQ